SMSATTPWERGRLDARRGKPRLLFGRMYEDSDVEAEVLPATGRVFCIASAGSTSMALAARGLAVTAVDINPAQVDYVRARLAGGFARHPSRTNPYAWQLFLGIDPPEYVAPTLPSPASSGWKVDVVCADAAAYLESCAPASFIGFSLSNILDGTEPAYGERLIAVVRHIAQDGPVAV